MCQRFGRLLYMYITGHTIACYEYYRWYNSLELWNNSSKNVASAVIMSGMVKVTSQDEQMVTCSAYDFMGGGIAKLLDPPYMFLRGNGVAEKTAYTCSLDYT